jgi:hypothetical protein
MVASFFLLSLFVFIFPIRFIFTASKTSNMQEKILILDFGSQYTQLIGRRVRELNVYCEIHPLTISRHR